MNKENNPRYRILKGTLKQMIQNLIINFINNTLLVYKKMGFNWQKVSLNVIETYQKKRLVIFQTNLLIKLLFYTFSIYR